MELLNVEIGEIEKRIAELETKLGDPAQQLSHQDYAQISGELEELNQRHRESLERWLELEEKAES